MTIGFVTAKQMRVAQSFGSGPPQSFELVGLFVSGNVTFDQAATTNGAPVVARFSGQIIRSPF